MLSPAPSPAVSPEPLTSPMKLMPMAVGRLLLLMSAELLAVLPATMLFTAGA